MFKKTIKYEDYNGIQREEDFYFHLNKAEMLELQLTKEGGFEAYLEGIIKAENTTELIKFFKELILMSYGVKSEDGKRFMKSDALREEFSQTEAFSELFTELATDDEAAANFVNGIFPQSQRLSDAELEKARIDAENRIKSLAPENNTESEVVVDLVEAAPDNTTTVETVDGVATGKVEE